MTRILADLPEDDVRELDILARRKKSSRAAVIRDAVKLYLVRNADKSDWIEAGRGFWKDRADIGDGLAYQNTIREDRMAQDEL